MKTMIVTNSSLTLSRMMVIANRTNSPMMAGAKAMMIENLKKQMQNGIAHFAYVKRDGTIREAWGTTKSGLVEKHINGNGTPREYYCTTAYFDVEAGGWRSFRWENLIAVA